MRLSERRLPDLTDIASDGLNSSYSDRVYPAAETLRRVWPYLSDHGITRVARQTGLDRVGISCWAAFRPNSRSLAGAQGKGLSDGRSAHGGLGMSIVAAIVRDLKGVLTVQGDRGAAFTIRAPLPSAQPNLVDRSFQSWAEA